MLIQDLSYENGQNLLQDAGDLDGQILADLRALQDKLLERRDDRYKDKKLDWLGRLIGAAEAGMGRPSCMPGDAAGNKWHAVPSMPGVPERVTKDEWYAMPARLREPLALAMAMRETKNIREYLPETIYVEKQSFHPDDWYLWSVAACRDEGAARVWDCWTLNLSTGGMNGGHYGLSYDGLRDALAYKKGTRPCNPQDDHENPEEE